MGAPGEWSVELPERGALRRGSRRPLAKVSPLGEEPQGGFFVPVAVGRRLKKRLEGSPAPAPCFPELSELVEAESASCSRERIASLVNRRDYSKSELVEKLVADGYAHDLAEASISWAEQIGLVDDSRFAQSFARAKALAGWGRLRIERELERRGIHPDELLLEEDELFGDEAERERATSIAARRVRGDASDFSRIVRLLASKGFSYGLSLRVARDLTKGESVFD